MKKNILIKLFLLCSTLAISQSNYYVSTTGNNANNGELSSPFLTIQYGVNQLSAGDVLHILEGTYEEKININVSGNPSAFITIKNYQNDEVIIDAINFADDDAIISILDFKAYIRIEGLHLTNNKFNHCQGITLEGAVHHIEIINNKVSNIWFDPDPNAPVINGTSAIGINAWGYMAQDSIHNLTIRGNEIFNNKNGYSENLKLNANVSGFIIEDNIVYDNTNIGIDVIGNYGESPTSLYDRGRNGIIRNNLVYNCVADYSGAAGIYIDGGKNIIVENNISHNNGYGGSIGCEQDGETRNIIFRNNIFYNNIRSGMSIGGYDVSTTGNVIDCHILNNTFYNNDTNDDSHGEITMTNLQDCTIENNIFYISNSIYEDIFLYAYRTQNNLSLNYNLVYNDDGFDDIQVFVLGSYIYLDNYYNNTGYGNNSVYGSPQLADAPNDFHISGSSLAVNTGNPNLIPGVNEVDIDGEERINDAIVDCGADEFYILSINEETLDDFISIYPNPTFNTFTINLKNETLKKAIIYNQLGQKIKEVTTKEVTISNLSKGVYFIKIISQSGKITTKKVTKK
ncbi:MAG: T9SS type A sorting domain-containing protein [Flavobacteriaceae bacterium]|nr:T9SS type A sorting domain-containing protein [Flavobacteriaceae bacterium]